MNKFFLFIYILLFSIQATAFNKDFKVEGDRIPTEFQLLFDSLKIEVKSDKEKFEMVGLIQEIGENLGILEKEHIFFLLKSEIIKNILEHKFEKVRQLDITTQFIERMEGDLKSKEKYLNPFSLWLWRSMIAELNFRKKIGLITNKSFSVNHFDGAKRLEALKFEKYLKYLTPWLDKMQSLSPTQFNKLTSDISWLILERINDRSIFFKRFATTLVSSTKTRLFNIPQKLLNIHPEDLKKAQTENKTEEIPLKEQSKNEKADAESTTSKISVDDMSTISDEVIKKIESKAE